MTGQVAADLRAAADVLERDGWTQGAYHRDVDGKTCHCAQGALAAAIGGNPLAVPLEEGPTDFTLSDRDDSRWDDANGALSRTLAGDYYVPAWNDDPDRTAAEVIAALRAAADRAEAEQ